MSQSPENRQNRLDELYEYGKSRGTITYKEIMDRLSGMDLDADQLDRVLETLEAYGVKNRRRTRPPKSPALKGMTIPPLT